MTLKQLEARLIGVIKNRKINIALFIVSLIVIFPRCFHLQNIEDNVDGSWTWALRYFVSNKNHYEWGKDVIYTYGPLGIFSTRNFPSSYIICQLLLDAFIIVQLVLGFTIVRQERESYAPMLFILSLSVLCWELNLLVQSISLFYVLYVINRTDKDWLVYLVFFNASILLYAKLNTVLISVCLMATLLAYLIKTKQLLRLLTCLGVFLVTNVFVVLFFNINASEYFLNSLPTIRFYSYTMDFYNPGYRHILIGGLITYITGIFLLLVNAFKTIRRNLLQSISLLVVCFFLYTLFKQGFTRMDRAHFTTYFSFLPFVFFLIYINSEWARKPALVCTTLSVCISVGLTAISFIKSYPFYCTPCVDKPPIIGYLTDLLNPAIIVGEDKGYVYPNSGSTVDYLYNNCIHKRSSVRLAWQNRPAFQSIATVSRSLDSLNATNFEGSSAPTYVYYYPDAIDDRNCLWDEPMTFLNILRNYTVSSELLDSGICFIKSSPKKITNHLLLDTLVSFNGVINLPKSDRFLLAIYAEANDNIIGKIETALYQSPDIGITLYYGEDSLSSYRYIMPLHNNSPLIVSHYFQKKSLKELHSFLSNIQGTKSNVSSIRFHSPSEYLFQKQIKLRIAKVQIQESHSERTIVVN